MALIPAWLPAALLLAGTATATAQATAQDGIDALNLRQYGMARRILAPLAAQDDPLALYGIGILDDLGPNGHPNSAAAFRAYARAADAGVPQAAFNAGAMADAGIGTPRDESLAALFFARAAAYGFARAAYDLATLYRGGSGVPRNPQIAAAWFNQAATQGIAASRNQPEPPQPAGSATPATPLWPRDEAHLTPYQGKIPLVWTAPPEPWPAHFQVQVLTGDTPASLHQVFASTQTTTAALVTLPDTPAGYAWRVDTISPNGEAIPGSVRVFAITPGSEETATK